MVDRRQILFQRAGEIVRPFAEAFVEDAADARFEGSLNADGADKPTDPVVVARALYVTAKATPAMTANWVRDLAPAHSSASKIKRLVPGEKHPHLSIASAPVAAKSERPLTTKSTL